MRPTCLLDGASGHNKPAWHLQLHPDAGVTADLQLALPAAALHLPPAHHIGHGRRELVVGLLHAARAAQLQQGKGQASKKVHPCMAGIAVQQPGQGRWVARSTLGWVGVVAEPPACPDSSMAPASKRQDGFAKLPSKPQLTLVDSRRTVGPRSCTVTDTVITGSTSKEKNFRPPT